MCIVAAIPANRKKEEFKTIRKAGKQEEDRNPFLRLRSPRAKAIVFFPAFLMVFTVSSRSFD